MSETRLKIFSGNSNKALAKDICKAIRMPLGQATVASFPDGETFVKIDENIRGHDVFIIQSTCPPTNQHLMELLIMIDAARRASANRITAVLPVYGYAPASCRLYIWRMVADWTDHERLPAFCREGVAC